MEHPTPQKTEGWLVKASVGFLRALGILSSICVVLMLLQQLLDLPRHREAQGREHTRNRIASLAAGCRYYVEEYGAPPYGDLAFESERDWRRLLDALGGRDENANPKRVVFWEENPEKSGAMDHWGQHLRVRFRDKERGFAESPYADDASSRTEAVLVWSIGKDGVLGSAEYPGRLKDSDDLRSW